MRRRGSPWGRSAGRYSCVAAFRRDAPLDLAAGAQGYQLIVPKHQALRYRPWIARQRDPLLVARQAIEVCAEFGGEALETLESARGVENLRVQFDAGVR